MRRTRASSSSGCVTNSEQVRARLGAPKRFAYGPTPIEGLDVFATKRPNAPINVFIHGGAWRAGMAKDVSLRRRDVRQRRRALRRARLQQRDRGSAASLMPMARAGARARSPGSTRMPRASAAIRTASIVSGHSSGGHLAGVLLITDWQKDFGVPADVIKGGCCRRGMYDLKPVRLSSALDYVKFTDEMEHALSTQRHLDKLNCPVIVPTARWRRRSSSASRATSRPR